MRLEELLDSKHHRVVTISSEQSVANAMEQLLKENIGALLVIADEKPWGLFTPKDLLHCLHCHPQHDLTDLPIKKVVLGELVTAGVSDSIGSSVEKMINADISHLSIIQEEAVVGMISLTDLMAFQINSLITEIEGLEGYITDLQTAELD